MGLDYFSLHMCMNVVTHQVNNPSWALKTRTVNDSEDTLPPPFLQLIKENPASNSKSILPGRKAEWLHGCVLNLQRVKKKRKKMQDPSSRRVESSSSQCTQNSLTVTAKQSSFLRTGVSDWHRTDSVTSKNRTQNPSVTRNCHIHHILIWEREP